MALIIHNPQDTPRYVVEQIPASLKCVIRDTVTADLVWHIPSGFYREKTYVADKAAARRLAAELNRRERQQAADDQAQAGVVIIS